MEAQLVGFLKWVKTKDLFSASAVLLVGCFQIVRLISSSKALGAPPFELSISSVTPAPAWPGSALVIHFSLKNGTDHPTAGYVNAMVSGQAVRGQWKDAPIVDLASGQSTSGTLSLSVWSPAVAPSVETVKVNYWIVVPEKPEVIEGGPPAVAGHLHNPPSTETNNPPSTETNKINGGAPAKQPLESKGPSENTISHVGTSQRSFYADVAEDMTQSTDTPEGAITFLNRDLETGQPHPVTYGIAATASSAIELYPSCAPAGPDFIRIEYFRGAPAAINVHKTELFFPGDTCVAEKQPVTLAWKVSSAGFPAFGSHPGSLASVTLSGPLSATGGPTCGWTTAWDERVVSSADSKANDFTNMRGDPKYPLRWRLRASGNCGITEQQQTTALHPVAEPPSVTKFRADPTYIVAGSATMLSWDVFNCPKGKCSVGIIGVDELNNVNFKADSLRASGGLKIQPPHPSKYRLTAVGEAQQAATAETELVKLAPAPAVSGQTYYFRMEWKESDAANAVTPCFGLAVFAPNQTSAKQMAEAQNGGYKATAITPDSFDDPCGLAKLLATETPTAVPSTPTETPAIEMELAETATPSPISAPTPTHPQ